MARRPGSNEFVFPIMVIVRIDIIVITNITIHHQMIKDLLVVVC